MSTASEVSICSNALLMLGDKPISSFKEADSPTNIARSQLCGNLYPQVRNAVLRGKNWNCARARQLVMPSTEKPAFEYTAKFLKPGDWLRTIQVGHTGSDLDFKDEGGFILANVDSLPLIYIFKNESVQTYDVLLVEVLTHAMAWRMAYPVTKSTSLMDKLEKALLSVWQQASAVDGQDDGPEDLGSFDMLSARLGTILT